MCLECGRKWSSHCSGVCLVQVSRQHVVQPGSSRAVTLCSHFLTFQLAGVVKWPSAAEGACAVYPSHQSLRFIHTAAAPAYHPLPRRSRLLWELALNSLELKLLLQDPAQTGIVRGARHQHCSGPASLLCHCGGKEAEVCESSAEKAMLGAQEAANQLLPLQNHAASICQVGNRR